MPNRQPSTPAQASEPGTITASSSDGQLIVAFKGRWDVRTVMAQERALMEIAQAAEQPSRVDVSEVTLLDTVGAIAIIQVRDRLGAAGDTPITGARDAQAALIDQVMHADAQPLPRLPRTTLVDRVARLGEWAMRIGGEARALLGFFGELCVVLARTLRHPRRLRLTATVHHMQAVGLDAMPIVGLLAFLIGIVLAYQSADQLKRFGAGIFIVNLLGISILRELGILITAIIVAGRSGSAFTAEIGTMEINQEVDAMRTIGLDPMEMLVLPRTLALMLMLIPLGFFANVVALFGGALMADNQLGVTLSQFVTQFKAAVELRHLWVGLIKTPFFAFVIAMVGCYHGLEVTGSAESVGRHTTQSVVQSIFLVIALDALFSVIFSEIGW